MAKLVLFIELLISDIFHFHDRPDRKLIKQDKNHYASPEGRRKISPSTAVMKDDPEKHGETYLNKKG